MNGVAFYGPPGAGKSTAARYLASKHGFRRHSFADKLRREVVAALCPHSFSFVEDKCRSCEQYMSESRDPNQKHRYVPLLQAWGQFRREETPDYWVDPVRQWIRYNRQFETARTVIDDLRHDNERLMCIEMDVLPVYLDAPPRLDKPDHVSEHDWKKWPMGWSVRNHGTLDELYQNLDAFVEDLTHV